MASQETSRVDLSPLIAPTINSAMAPTARMISGSAGAMSGSGNSGIAPTHNGGRNYSLSAPGGGEGRGELGVASSSERWRSPPHPPIASRRVPPSPPASGRRGAKRAGLPLSRQRRITGREFEVYF